MTVAYRDQWYQSVDGLRLYARDYNASQTPEPRLHQTSRPVILCLHGLSRNSADFEALAPVLARQARVLVADQRGRGLSQWDPEPGHYHPATYVEDMWRLLDQLDIARVVLIGTSMGVLMSMMMAAAQPERVQGVVLNDIGPEVAPAGLARIMSYVGKPSPPIGCWEDAIARTRTLNESCFPSYDTAQWRQMARRLYRENEAGVPVLAYDPAISQPIDTDTQAAVPADLWPLFESLRGKPLLMLRGALSDLLAPECLAEMARRAPGSRAVDIPGVGHAPMLDEPEARAAIEAFLQHLPA